MSKELGFPTRKEFEDSVEEQHIQALTKANEFIDSVNRGGTPVMSKTIDELLQEIAMDSGFYDDADFTRIHPQAIAKLTALIADRERLAVLHELDTIEALDDPEKIPDNYAALSAIEDYVRTRQNQLLTGVAELSTEGEK